MRISSLARLSLAACLLTWAMPAAAQPPSHARSALARAAADAGAVPSSFDDDGVPRFLRAAGDHRGPGGATPDAAARWHLARFARAYGVTDADVAASAVVQVQSVGAGRLVHLKQRVGGVEVHGSDMKVLMRGGHQLVSISGRPRSIRGAGLKDGAFAVPAAAALAGALSHLFGGEVSPVSVTPVAPADPGDPKGRFLLAPGSSLRLSEPAAVAPVLYPSGQTVVPAYIVDFYAGPADSGDSVAFRYVVAADDGRVLDRRDLTISETSPQADGHGPPPTFDYRVFADTSLRPLDNPQDEYSPNPVPVPDGFQPPYIFPILATVGGLNQQPSAVADAWLPGSATETNGNNVDAYADHAAPDGFTAGDFRADLTGARSFDRTYDTSAGPLATVDQSKAAVTHAFYTINWLHDYWYDSGFNEAAGNAQHDNYGRGGLGGDAMRVEVQDNYFGGSRNNANMSTPADGVRPRMQMYVWSGPQSASLTLTPGGTRAVGTASFGPTNFDLTAPVLLANDGTPVTTNACEPFAGAAGYIVLVDRGVCTFVVKAQNVQNAGGVGIIVANNAAASTPPGLGGAAPGVTIPVLSITQADGNALKTALASGAVTARMFRYTGTEVDSALDTTILAHEWGHYLHHRLSDCGTPQCGAQSEGWGDFLALHTMARSGDNLNGTYAVSAYAGLGIAPHSQYRGIRRAPFSVDFTHNPLTFRHVADGVALPAPVVTSGPNSEVHNAGEIWATALWEAYVALQQERTAGRTFDDVRRTMADYVVGGLQLAPRDATFTETRDAILAAAAAARPDSDAGDPDDRGAGGADVLVLAKAFARRGLGTCAVSPPITSTTFVGAVESFEVKPRLAIGEIRLEEERRSCDRDGYLDAGEQGRVLVTILNGGPLEMRDVTVSVSSPLAALTFPSGASVRIARLPPLGTTQVAIPVALAASFAGIGQLQLDVAAADDEACEGLVTRSLFAYVNVDDVTGASRIDTVESAATAWTPTGVSAPEIWSRVEAAPFNRAWLGIDFGSASDTQLMSPALAVSPTAPLVFTFDHRFSFEAPAFDGGVLELSRDGGLTWEDVATYANPGYNGTLSSGSGNPLSGRAAFVRQNASWPARDTLSLDLGTALAGQTVHFRFRIGTDVAVSDFGWELDNLSFSGITNTPFGALVEDRTVCRR